MRYDASGEPEYSRTGSRRLQSGSEMDDHPLFDDELDDHPPLDSGKEASLVPPPRLAMYLGNAIQGTWAGLYIGATWGLLLWGTLGAVIGAICGLVQGLVLGSWGEVRAQAAALAFFGAVYSGLFMILALSAVGTFVGFKSTGLIWRIEREQLAKLLQNGRQA
jgi:hypothetical protein